jgi:hypothetical protein
MITRAIFLSVPPAIHSFYISVRNFRASLRSRTYRPILNPDILCSIRVRKSSVPIRMQIREPSERCNRLK